MSVIGEILWVDFVRGRLFLIIYGFWGGLMVVRFAWGRGLGEKGEGERGSGDTMTIILFPSHSLAIIPYPSIAQKSPTGHTEEEQKPRNKYINLSSMTRSKNFENKNIITAALLHVSV